MENNKTYNDLTERQIKLFELFKDVYKIDNDRFLTNKEIYKALRSEYPKLNYKSDWNNQNARRQITEDILALKKSKYVELTILTTARGNKIAKESEVEELEKRKISLLKSLKVIYSQMSKIKLDGQKRIAFEKEKEFIESFIVG